MCLQSLCTGNFLYHAKGKSNRQKQSWNLHFLAFQSSLQLKCQLTEVLWSNVWRSCNLRASCAALSAVPDNLNKETHFFLFSISIKNCFNTSQQKKQRGELHDTTSPKRLNQLTSDDRLTENEWIFTFSVFFSCFSIEWEMCFGFLRQTNRTLSVLCVVYSSTWIKFARLSIFGPLTGISHNKTRLTPEIARLSATLPANFSITNFSLGLFFFSFLALPSFVMSESRPTNIHYQLPACKLTTWFRYEHKNMFCR